MDAKKKDELVAALQEAAMALRGDIDPRLMLADDLVGLADMLRDEWAKAPTAGLCEDEGCDHHGTKHVCFSVRNPPAPATNAALSDLISHAIKELQWPGEQRVAKATAMLHMALALADSTRQVGDTAAIQAVVPHANANSGAYGPEYQGQAAAQFDSKEIALLAIAMTVAGLARYGQRPAPVTMETLVRQEVAMHALTAKVVDMMTATSVEAVAG